MIALLFIALVAISGCGGKHEDCSTGRTWGYTETRYGKSDTLRPPIPFQVEANGDTTFYWTLIIEREPYPIDSFVYSSEGGRRCRR